MYVIEQSDVDNRANQDCIATIKEFYSDDILFDATVDYLTANEGDK